MDLPCHSNLFPKAGLIVWPVPKTKVCSCQKDCFHFGKLSFFFGVSGSLRTRRSENENKLFKLDDSVLLVVNIIFLFSRSHTGPFLQTGPCRIVFLDNKLAWYDPHDEEGLLTTNFQRCRGQVRSPRN
jgi:hypothetical protein